MGVVRMITAAVSPWQAGRNLMAENELVTVRTDVIASICTVVFLTYLNLQSVSVININPRLEKPQRVLIWASFHVVPKAVGTFVLPGVMAAGLSSASTFLSVAGFFHYLRYYQPCHQRYGSCGGSRTTDESFRAACCKSEGNEDIFRCRPQHTAAGCSPQESMQDKAGAAAGLPGCLCDTASCQ